MMHATVLGTAPEFETMKGQPYILHRLRTMLIKDGAAAGLFLVSNEKAAVSSQDY